MYRTWEIKSFKNKVVMQRSFANLLSFSTKSGGSAAGDVEHWDRISESESC